MTKEYHDILKIVKRSPEGLGWPIPIEYVIELQKDFDLKMECRNGDINGEASAVFHYKGTIYRLKRTWMSEWELYKGDWKSDPHWTGD